MRARTQRNEPDTLSGFFDLIKKYWIVILGLIFATPVILRYLKDSQVKNEINDQEEQIKLNQSANLSPISQQSGLNKITTNMFLQNMARSLAHNLGTLYQSKPHWWSILDPRGWTENDKAVYDDLKQLTNSGQIRLVSECYFFLTAKNLKEDVRTLLDTELFSKLPLFK